MYALMRRVRVRARCLVSLALFEHGRSKAASSASCRGLELNICTRRCYFYAIQKRSVILCSRSRKPFGLHDALLLPFCSSVQSRDTFNICLRVLALKFTRESKSTVEIFRWQPEIRGIARCNSVYKWSIMRANIAVVTRLRCKIDK